MPKIKKNPEVIYNNLQVFTTGFLSVNAYEMIDIKTGVRYICNHHGGLAPRLNSDGTLMLASQAEIEELLKTRG